MIVLLILPSLVYVGIVAVVVRRRPRPVRVRAVGEAVAALFFWLVGAVFYVEWNRSREDAGYAECRIMRSRSRFSGLSVSQCSACLR
jgi:hypothetical protein